MDGDVVQDAPADADEYEIPFEAFGVRAALHTNRPELLKAMQAVLPPGWQPASGSEAERRFGITAEKTGMCTVSVNENALSRNLDLELALGLLDSQLRLYLGRQAPDAIFIHAGAVAHRGAAIVLPGKSFAGKTTLVAALVRAGATYFSDEFAVLDDSARVHPYAKPVSVRGEDHKQVDHALSSLGWTPGAEPLPVAAIVVTSYRPDGEWRPRRLSAGEAAMKLLANAVPARKRPAEVMRATSRAAANALALESERGEADEVAPLLLAELEKQTA
jgi:hypothetical protein